MLTVQHLELQRKLIEKESSLDRVLPYVDISQAHRKLEQKIINLLDQMIEHLRIENRTLEDKERILDRCERLEGQVTRLIQATTFENLRAERYKRKLRKALKKA